jgi:hypothetical protein
MNNVVYPLIFRRPDVRLSDQKEYLHCVQDHRAALRVLPHRYPPQRVANIWARLFVIFEIVCLRQTVTVRSLSMFSNKLPS